ncbi:TPA: hypothetical protein ACG4ML_000693 [Stenotrophomonas maltophilia]|jgi:hypothetical protein|uniref:hypothetical protein n=1 Tax=Burkholderia sp. LMG 13014 TaxID=2709306 RepID=UPI001965A670|nr:hypothetical protein [Burkholderia sp. LMG 13014]HDS1368500.1 hypothetical protein [Stenotrophomonas maltophilia]HEJ3239945.1 hypothetical protein [Pseudomonas aeruginosa]HDS1373219.1 hypothetical protein [Stenotrophomonas maltophilia]HDS1376542.1 hypothetical protein [Stenotrophomonas maltophilia]HDS1381396.1 hypothetical protein [Stenotrophomonas maltophilia]
MNATTQATPETVNARLTLDVTYLLNGEAAPELLARLERMCELAIGEGLLTGETAAEVDTWSIDVSEVPSAADRETLEAEIAAFMQQRIEDGNLSAEDIPLRLARYGLMAPEAFADEMRERMGMDDDAPTGQAVIPSAEPADGSEIEMQVAVVCIGASGSPDVPVFKVRITQEEYDLGIHYDKARDLAEEARYEGPFICFDAAEYGPILSAARELGLVPQVVVVDMTDGQIHSIRCDSGEIKVICYDTSDTEEYSAAVANRPLGENGQFVRCWSHTQLAQVDPGLKLARD